MTTGCLATPRPGFGIAGAVTSSAAIFCFFVRRAGEGCIAPGVFFGLGSRSVGAFRLRDLGGSWGWGTVDVEAETLD